MHTSPPWGFWVTAGLLSGLLAVGARAAPTVTVASIVGNCILLGSGPLSNGAIVTKEMRDLGPCDVILDVTGLTPGQAATVKLWEVVANATAHPWHDFHQELGYGSGVGFVPSSESDGVFFVDQPPPDGERFVLVGQDEAIQPDRLNWEVRSGSFPISPPFLPPITNRFDLDLHVNDVDAEGKPDADGMTRITLRQIATLNEPKGPALLMLALLLLPACRKPKRR